jgi:hypothetical protein
MRNSKNKKSNTINSKATSQATLNLTGVIEDIYEGEQADYLTFNVDNPNSEYYSTVKVRIDDNTNVQLQNYRKGDNVNIIAYPVTFFDKKKKSMVTTFTATFITGAEYEH